MRACVDEWMKPFCLPSLYSGHRAVAEESRSSSSCYPRSAGSVDFGRPDVVAERRAPRSSSSFRGGKSPPPLYLSGERSRWSLPPEPSEDNTVLSSHRLNDERGGWATHTSSHSLSNTSVFGRNRIRHVALFDRPPHIICFSSESFLCCN